MTWLCIAFAALLQQPLTITGVVLDPTGSPIGGASIVVRGAAQEAVATADAEGRWSASLAGDPASLRVTASAAGFSPAERTITNLSAPVRLELQPQGITERITVSAPGPERLAIQTSATVLDSAALEGSPALTLDDQLRSVPGFSLFRRTSSRVANPTTQGVTLRGLSASGASRTLVLLDGVPLNDPFGAWVSWDRVPAIALDRVEVIRGASSDMHGNDALGGVIRLSTRTRPGAQGRADLGGQGTRRFSGYAAAVSGPLLAGGAAETFDTDGYVTVAPEARGAIDVPATDRSRSVIGWLGAQRGDLAGLLRLGYLGETRGNGTPAQVNGTITRWGAATARGIARGGAWDARVDFNSGNYRQTFSAVAASRATERLTTLQWIHPRSAGANASWVRSSSRWTTLVAANVRLSRADLDEAGATAGGGFTIPDHTPARQRDVSGVLQQRVALSPRVVLEGGVSAAAWKSFRADAPEATRRVFFLEPRVALAIDAGTGRSLRVAWLSGFRTPTMNELFRSFRVGNAVTQANVFLTPEESLGPEVALTIHRPRWTVRLVGYETQLSGAIYNRTISATSALIQRVRSNGDARAIGSEIEAEWRPHAALALTTSWGATDSRFTSGELDGKLVPQVPRVQGAIGFRTTVRAVTGAIDVRVIGDQFDDDVNAFKLRAGSLVDGRIGWRVVRRGEVFAAIENALDREIDTGRTPIRTVGSPRVARGGISIKF